MSEGERCLDDLEGEDCPKCGREYPGPDYDGESGFCCTPWMDEPNPSCDRLHVARLEQTIAKLEAERARLAEEVEALRPFVAIAEQAAGLCGGGPWAEFSAARKKLNLIAPAGGEKAT